MFDQPELPLNPRVFALLLVIAEGPTHGYAMKQEIERRSGGTMVLDAGSLYRSLSRMVDDGWVAETDERPDPSDDDPRRRYYRLTPAGQRVLSAEARRLEGMLRSARSAEVLGPELLGPETEGKGQEA